MQLPLSNLNPFPPHSCTSCVPHAALLKLLDMVLPCFVETVRSEPERQVVMGILETLNAIMKSCKEEAFKNPSRLKEISHVIRDVLQKKVRRGDMALFVNAKVTKIFLHRLYFLSGSYASNPPPLFFSLFRLFVRTVVEMKLTMKTNRLAVNRCR